MDGWKTFAFPFGANGLFSKAFAVSFRDPGRIQQDPNGAEMTQAATKPLESASIQPLGLHTGWP